MWTLWRVWPGLSGAAPPPPLLLLVMLAAATVSQDAAPQPQCEQWCRPAAELLLQRYREVALQRNTAQREKFVEVSDLTQQLRRARRQLWETADTGRAEAARLQSQAGRLTADAAACQTSLDETSRSLGANAAVVITLLRSLRQAEERNSLLERQIAALKHQENITSLLEQLNSLRPTPQLVALRSALEHLVEHPAHRSDPIVACADSRAALASQRSRPAA